jgi:hypothetical protein
MLKWFLSDIPAWAMPENPVLRYELARYQPDVTPGRRVLRFFGWVTGLVALVLLGYGIATDWFQEPAGRNLSEALWRMLFFPALFLQVLLQAIAFSLSVNAISEERQQQRWESLRATENGASLALRTRIVAIMYRLRGLILPVLAVRVILIGALLYEMVSLRGDYLAILTATGSSVPSVPLMVAVALVAASMTAALVLPLTTIAADIALGLALSAGVRNRAVTGSLLVIIVAFRIAIIGMLLAGTLRFLKGALTLSDGLSWLWLAAYSVLADWGLLWLQLQQAGVIWSDVPYSVYIGGVLLLAVVVQMLLIKGLVRLAVRAAERTA